MELREALRRRRMVRDFTPEPLEPAAVEALSRSLLRGPSAGNTGGLDVVVLHGPVETARYWDASLPVSERPRFPWPGLLRAPLVIVLVVDEAAYRARYAEADKARRGAGAASTPAEGPWSVPWWYVDAGAAAGLALLTAVDLGLGALLFAVARPAAVGRSLGIPGDRQAVAALAVGHPGPDDRPASSGRRPARPPAERLHGGGW